MKMQGGEQVGGLVWPSLSPLRNPYCRYRIYYRHPSLRCRKSGPGDPEQPPSTMSSLIFTAVEVDLATPNTAATRPTSFTTTIPLFCRRGGESSGLEHRHCQIHSLHRCHWSPSHCGGGSAEGKPQLRRSHHRRIHAPVTYRHHCCWIYTQPAPLLRSDLGDGGEGKVTTATPSAAWPPHHRCHALELDLAAIELLRGLANRRHLGQELNTKIAGAETLQLSANLDGDELQVYFCYQFLPQFILQRNFLKVSFCQNFSPSPADDGPICRRQISVSHTVRMSTQRHKSDEGKLAIVDQDVQSSSLSGQIYLEQWPQQQICSRRWYLWRICPDNQMTHHLITLFMPLSSFLRQSQLEANRSQGYWSSCSPKVQWIRIESTNNRKRKTREDREEKRKECNLYLYLAQAGGTLGPRNCPYRSISPCLSLDRSQSSLPVCVCSSAPFGEQWQVPVNGETGFHHSSTSQLPPLSSVASADQ